MELKFVALKIPCCSRNGVRNTNTEKLGYWYCQFARPEYEVAGKMLLAL